jgi:hypothetical protein
MAATTDWNREKNGWSFVEHVFPGVIFRKHLPFPSPVLDSRRERKRYHGEMQRK